MKDCVATVGTFDGLHTGHNKILETVKDEAEKRGLESRVITFMQHPLSAIAPEKTPPLIMSRETVTNNLRDKVDRVSEIDFNAEKAAMTAAEFLALIAERYKVRVLVMGHDNTFGSDRLKTHEEYVEAGRKAGIEVVFVDPVMVEGEEKPVSSTLVREAMAQGDMLRLTKLIHSFPLIDGKVVEGKHNGRRIGFPTLNIDMTGRAPLAPGVYLACYIDEDDKDWYALLNAGTNPTIGEGNPMTYEVHVPGANLGDMYGKEIEITLLLKIRDETKFDSISDLKNQIQKDIDTSVTLFSEITQKMEDAFDLALPSLSFLYNNQKKQLARLKKEGSRLHKTLDRYEKTSKK